MAKDRVRTRVVIDRAMIMSEGPWEVIDPVWWSGNIYDGPTAYEESLQSFSIPQRLLFAMCWYEAEVSNGGHDQFYFNSTGVVWRDAMAGFDAAGIPEVAAIIGESSRRMGGDPPLDREARQDLLDRLNPDFDDLDRALYALDLHDRIAMYVRANASDFLFDGDVLKPPP
ncbi:MAG: DMP19 family protein [Hyphomonadaceae bacterium]|nr:DMP19 family protein [Hyphomonadaceae bacterium]